MGCDIHGYCEIYENGKWEMAGGFNNKYSSDEPYEGRNYNLFSLLANVRNSGNITPISLPRGVPKDASESYQRIVEECGSDGHSHSFLMLDELLLVDHDKLIEKKGIIGEKTYREAKKGVVPTSYCGGSSGPNLYVLTNDEMDLVLENRQSFIEQNLLRLLYDKKRMWDFDCPAAKGVMEKIEKFNRGEMEYGDIEFNTKYVWKTRLGECLGTDFFGETVPAMLAKSPSGDSIDVRYIFFFDN